MLLLHQILDIRKAQGLGNFEEACTRGMKTWSSTPCPRSKLFHNITYNCILRYRTNTENLSKAEEMTLFEHWYYLLQKLRQRTSQTLINCILSFLDIYWGFHYRALCIIPLNRKIQGFWKFSKALTWMHTEPHSNMCVVWNSKSICPYWSIVQQLKSLPGQQWGMTRHIWMVWVSMLIVTTYRLWLR